jgi:hypothetical protein
VLTFGIEGGQPPFGFFQPSVTPGHSIRVRVEVKHDFVGADHTRAIRVVHWNGTIVIGPFGPAKLELILRCDDVTSWVGRYGRSASRPWRIGNTLFVSSMDRLLLLLTIVDSGSVVIANLSVVFEARVP